MTTTSLLHHKPPLLKTRNDNSAVYLRANNYYGSVGRPSHGRRKSAVELLQESKAFYVKSESVLDTKQEFKNADHLQVRSPTLEMSAGGGGMLGGGHYRGGPPPPSAPPSLGVPSFHYATFTHGSCPPYPHEHLLDHNSIQLMHTNYLNSLKKDRGQQGTKVTAKVTLIDTNAANSMKSTGENWDVGSGKKFTRKESTRRSIQPPGSLPIVGKEVSSVVVSKSSIGGVPMTFTSFSQNGSLYSLEKHSIATANLPVITSVSSSSVSNTLSNHGTIRERKEDSSEADSPPPLPPKSPRTTSKPPRPHDFPQRLVQVQQGPLPNAQAPDAMLPPPPPRRVHHESADVHSKLRRIIHDQQHHKNVSDSTTTNIIPPMTLPSPILPPTPPPDVVMESPMSDSGPIISPPPAFSTPVTPMLDRQNSSVSDRPSNAFYGGNHPPQVIKAPLSAAVSMSGVSSISSRSRKSIPDDVSMRYSPRSRSRSRSSSSPMSHQDVKNNSSRGSGGSGSGVCHGGVTTDSVTSEEDSEEAISADLEGDDDDSSRAQDRNLPKRNNSKKSQSSSGISSRPSPKKLISSKTATTGNPSKSSQKTALPKSVTENFLCRVVAPPQSQQIEEPIEPVMITGMMAANNNYNHAAQTLPMVHTPRPRIVSPVRRPILRSKSDLSHRYIKASRSSTLTPGFTLVHVDLGQPSSNQSQPPPIPIHNSVSTNDFVTSGRNYENYYHHPHYQNHLQHHTTHHLSTIYSRPKIHNNLTAYENLLNGRTDLDRFFDQLGLDSEVSVAPPPCPLSKINKGKVGGSESPVYFPSVSSVDSGARKSGSGDSEDSPIPPASLGKVIGSRQLGLQGQHVPGGVGYSSNNNSGNNNNNPTTTTTNNTSSTPSIVIHHGEPSIVERNARVIKWLFNCRKAMDSTCATSKANNR